MRLVLSSRNERVINASIKGDSFENVSMIAFNFLGSTPIRLPKMIKSSLQGWPVWL